MKEPIQENLIRPIDINKFKKQPGERKYGTIMKFQMIANRLMNPEQQQEIPATASDEMDVIGIGSKLPEQTIITIGGLLDIVDKNLQNNLVLEYLSKTFGEEQASMILQERNVIQNQLREQYNEIINSMIKT